MGRFRRRLRLPTRGWEDVARELDDEIRTHIAMRTEELVARGIPPEEARAEARRRFGGAAAARRLHATARRADARRRWRDRAEGLARDLGYAVRQARQNPGFTAAAVVILALGLGLTTSMFTLVDHVLVRALPFPDSHQLVSLQSVPASGGSFNSTSMANWVDWRERNRTLESTGIYRAWNEAATVSLDHDVLSVPVQDVAGQFFETLRPSMRIGRAFTEAEAQDGAGLAVVSEGFWRRVLGADPALDGRELTVNGRRVSVVGVLASGQEFPGGIDLWVATEHRPGSGAMRNNVNWSAVARLQPEASRQRAQADLSRIARGIMEQDPEAVYSHGVVVKPLSDVVVADVRPGLMVLMGAALFVLAVACANLAGLSLARARRREQEVAVRLTLGAGRGRVLRQIVVEHVVLALAGGALGILGAWLATGAVTHALGTTLPRAHEVSFDARIASFGFVAALVSGALAGALPAWQAARQAPGEALSGVRGQVRGGRGMAGAALVGAEVALAVLLVTGGGLLLRSFQSLLDRDLGYEPRGAVTASIRLVTPEYAEPENRLRYWDTLLDEIEGLPGVQSLGIANWIPTQTAGTGWVDLADQPGREAGAGYRIVSDDYLETLGVPVLEGRGFDDRDAAGAARTVLVNRRMAETYWPEGSAVGQRIRARSMEEWLHRHEGLDPWLTVVGVVGDVRHYGFEDEPSSEMYVLYRQIPYVLGAMTAVVRSDATDPGALAARIRERARNIDPALAVEVGLLEEQVSGLLRVRRLLMTVLGTFAALALALACLGVYGLLSFVVAERTREFAVRAALGARRGGIAALTLRGAAPILLGGSAAGLAAAYPLSGFLEAQLVQVTPVDPVTYLGSAVLLVTVGVGAALLPAGRAAGLDPVETLREG